MSFSKAKQKRFIVTASTKEGMQRLYDQLESAESTPTNTSISRPVLCAERRPTSRSTTYYLTSKEAISLKNHPDVKSVQPYPTEVGIAPELNAVTQTSNFSRSSTQNSNHKSWGLLRCVEGGVQGEWNGDNTQTITLTETGKNVDVIICDGEGVVNGHPEFAVNVDGTGGSRINLYDWYAQHQGQVGGTGTSYSYSSGSYHAVHVMGSAGGNTQGWARDANLYNLYYFAGANGDFNFPYVFDYIREFHRTKSINQDTGRKNPTIVNNSWGMSIFPSQWSFDDITAVTYRGTRITPANITTEASGFSGIFTSSDTNALQTFTVSDNDSYLHYTCSTSGSETQASPEAVINGTPTGDSGWAVSNQKSATFSKQTRIVNSTQNIVVNVTSQPITADVIHRVDYGTPSGTVDLRLRVIAVSPSNEDTTFDTGLFTGADLALEISETITFNETGTWNVQLITEYSTEPNPNCTYDCFLNLSLNTTFTTPPAASKTLVASGQGNVSIADVSALNADTSPNIGDNDDGYFTVPIPFDIEFLSVTYDQLYVGTNGYITFGNGSLAEPVSANQVTQPKIMIGSGNKNGDSQYASTSCQRIYYGAEPTGNYSSPVNTYSIDVINNSNVAWTLSNGSDRNGAVSGDNPTINIIVGDTIELTSNSNFAHPLYIKIAQVVGSGSLVGGAVNQGAYGGTTVSWTPTTPGTYYYQCGNHNDMNGQIIVGSNDSTQYFRVVFEGTAQNTGTLGSPNVRWEVRFDEENPADFRVITEQVNQVVTSGGSFTTQELNDLGFIAGKRIPSRVDALDSDIEDAISEGIITVGAAGNGQWYHALPGDQDWDNTFEMANRYPDSVNFPYYYMRGTSPTANDTAASGGYEIPNICVGAVGDYSGLDDKIADYSDRGPGVDIFAPGTYIQSSYNSQSSTVDPRNGAYRVAKISGTSMASPQVAGVLACLLETYPDMNQYEAKALIKNLADEDDLVDTTGGYADLTDLIGAPNQILRYIQQRKAQGTTFPKRNYKGRPDSGVTYPRPQIRR